MKIGRYEIGEGAFLAPMAGVTNPPFRQLCREMGAVFSTTELISAHALIFLASRPSNQTRKTGVKTRTLLHRFPGETPFAVQLFGRDPDRMAEAARIAESFGADVLDLNFGCPARKVVKDGEGGGVALMRNPALLETIARTVVARVSVPVTAKIRLGWSPDEISAPDAARRLEDAGISALCVHARTRDQVHAGPVNLDALARTCAAVRIPVVGNGGIRSRADAEEMMRQTGCARVAVGQAARGNPWIFQALAGRESRVAPEQRVAIFLRHLDLYRAWVGEPRAVLEMRKHACWYFKGFVGAGAMRQRLAHATDVQMFQSIVSEIAEPAAPSGR